MGCSESNKAFRFLFLDFCTNQSIFTCSKLTTETLKQRAKYVHFEHISHLVLVFLLLTLSR